ncbi:MAG: hypothetical protein RIM99_14935 [Cyclobacteriaceae bacterium]
MISRTTILFFVLLIGKSVNLHAQCPPSGGGDFNGSITITGNCVVTGNLVLKKNNLTITSTGSLTVNGNFTNDGNGNVSIDGAFTVTGSFNNAGNGVITVDNGGVLDVGTDYDNNGNGTTNFLDGDITIGGNYTNDGNGNIAADGVVNIGGDFTVSGNGVNTVSGGLNIGGTADLGSNGIDITDGGVLQANAIVTEGDIDIAAGGTINVESGSITGTGTVNNDPSNADQDCTNNCCGALCNPTGDDLGSGGDGVLPVELLYFNTKQDGASVVAQWSTATELNNDYFTLERSFDGKVFELVDRIKGAGNYTGRLDYSLQDVPGYFGLVYYRLTQTDFDGTSEVFPLANILLKNENENHLIYPTLLNTGQQITIANFWGELKGVDLVLLDVSGKSTYKPQLEIGYQIKINTDDLPNGVFLLRGSINGLHVSRRIIINR